MNKNIRTPENGIEAVDFAIRTEMIQKDLKAHKGNVDYCSDVITSLNEEEAKAILKHTFYKN